MIKNKELNRVRLNETIYSDNERDVIKDNLFVKYLTIKQDLITNLKDIFNRRNYYTKKYRGNLLTDIHVGLDYDENVNKMIQVFIRHKGIFIKDELVFNEKGIISTNIKTNLYD